MFPVVWVRVWVLKLGTRVLRVRVPSTQAPTLPGDLLFLVRFRRRRRSANTFQLSGKTPEANFFKPHMVDVWVWKIFLAPILVTLGQGH